MVQFEQRHINLLSHMDANLTAERDQVQLGCSLPVTYQPFKFDSRRFRIDWRLLHGVDIHKVIRDTDLDTLERLVSCITWGDIEAEDTRHLSESNFVKIFRLAQLLLEYLLYVQDNLKFTNTVLEQSRAAVLIHAQALTARCHEMQGQLKLSKKELRSARKTVKTLELMAAAVQAGAIPPKSAAVAGDAGAANLTVNMRTTVQDQIGQREQGASAIQQGGQHQQQLQPQQPQQLQPQQQPQQPQMPNPVFEVTSADVMLQTQLAELTDRMAVAGCDLERLREEREELQYQVRYMYDMLAAKTGGEKTAQRHFSPARSGMFTSRATGSPTTWRRQYGEQYNAAAAAQAQAAAEFAADAAAQAEVARRTAILEQQHAAEMAQLREHYEKQLQQRQQHGAEAQQRQQEQLQQRQQHNALAQQHEQELQQREAELQKCRQELQQCQQQLGVKSQKVQELESELQSCTLQLEQQQEENSELRQDLREAASSPAPKSGNADSLIASLKEQLNDKIRECTYLQGEVNQRETSIATFKQANDLLERELEALRNERVAPEAAAPSFVAKQRKSIALAETQVAKSQQQVTELMRENMELAQQVADLRSRLAAGGGSGNGPPVAGDTAAAAEQLLSGRSSITSSSKGPAASTAAAEKAWQQVAELRQDKLALTERCKDLEAKLAANAAGSPQERGAEWKLQEIERLQNENRLLQNKVTSLQQQCAELERENALLERQAVKARNLGLAVSLQASASSTPGSDLAAAIAAQTSGANIASQSLGSWARASSASAASSGPRAELTAADLAAGGMIPGPGSSASRPSSAQLQAASSGADTDSDEPSEQVTTVTVRPAAAGQQRKGGSSVEFRSSAVAGKPDQSWIKKAADENSDDGHAESGDRIAAYRPEAQEPLPPPPAVLENVTTVSRPPAALAASTPPAQTTATASHAGQISKDAAAQLKSLIVEVAATPLELLEGEYKEFCDDWDLPFDLKPEEHEWFHELLPHDVPGRMGLLTTTPHSPDEYAANQGRLMIQVNKQLDAELASYGLHPGRTGLSQREFLAAMRMLSERRAAWESRLSPEQRQHVEAARCGILLHAYNVSQGVLQQQPDGPDGKKRLPGGVRPSLTSAVRPPASMLPAGPAAIRTTVVRSMAGEHTDLSALLAPSRYQQFDSSSEAGSPIPYSSAAAASSTAGNTAGPLAASRPGPPSPARAAAIAAAMQLAGREHSYSRGEPPSGLSSPDLSQAGGEASAGPTGFSPMSAALQRRSSLQSQASLQSQSSLAGTSHSGRVLTLTQPAAIVGSHTSDAGTRPGTSPGQQSAGVVAAAVASIAGRPATTDTTYQPSSSSTGPVGPSRFSAAAATGASKSTTASAGHRHSTAQLAGSPAGSPKWQPRNVSPGIAAAMKQFSNNSFDDSDEI